MAWIVSASLHRGSPPPPSKISRSQESQCSIWQFQPSSFEVEFTRALAVTRISRVLAEADRLHAARGDAQAPSGRKRVRYTNLTIVIEYIFLVLSLCRRSQVLHCTLRTHAMPLMSVSNATLSWIMSILSLLGKVLGLHTCLLHIRSPTKSGFSYKFVVLLAMCFERVRNRSCVLM